MNKIFLLLIILNLYRTSKNNDYNEYILQSNERQFLTLIYLKEKIQITVIEIEIISSSYFYTELSLESLCKYNKIFKQYDNLEDAYNGIQKLFEKENIKVYAKNGYISLGFIMNSASCDSEEVIIKLEEKKMSKEEIDEKVRIETNNLRKRIKILEEENKKLNNMINNFESRLDYLELRNEKIDTKIINRKSEIQFILDEFKEKYNKNSISFKLLYRASRDGVQFRNLNSKLRNYNHNLLFLFHIKEGLKFGAFLYKGLNNKYINYGNNYSPEPKSFIFGMDSNNKNKIYYPENDENIISFNSQCSNEFKNKEYIINFCSNDLLIQEKNINYINKFVRLVDESNTLEKNEGKKYFNLKELEVFQISYDMIEKIFL